jgi:hypothetical protein
MKYAVALVVSRPTWAKEKNGNFMLHGVQSCTGVLDAYSRTGKCTFKRPHK